MPHGPAPDQAIEVYHASGVLVEGRCGKRTSVVRPAVPERRLVRRSDFIPRFERVWRKLARVLAVELIGVGSDSSVGCRVGLVGVRYVAASGTEVGGALAIYARVGSS
jgi:hypothetical protein